MLNFDFYNPTRVIFGDDRIAELPKRIPHEARILILYGNSARNTGTLDEVLDSLVGHEVFEFGGIEPNPSYEMLIKAVEVVKAEKIDFLLAVGGGSVIDGAKFVAAAACYESGDPLDLLTRRARILNALPLGVVLTLAATGSESNNGAVITHLATHTKHTLMSERLYPVFAILDPTKTFTLDARQIGNGVVDAFVHITEQYLTYPVNSPVQDRIAEGLLLTLIEQGPMALASGRDYDVRANLMWTASLALNGLIGAGVPHDWATHMIGHELTALYNIDHARTLAIVLPSMLKVRKEAKHAKLVQYAERVWGLTEGEEDQRIRYALARTSKFFESMGLPTKLSAYNLGQDAVEAVLKQLEAHNMTALGEKRDVTLDISRKVLEGAL
ncbi:NADP-dependent alcohol dehydrogenase [Fluviicoccus keumensis]|uniref:NADP-dependent alcohol dehydrogenase n=1 Tax=Fluviicoccus keumensis TaxID=1435465 RepID=A0A4Q7Z4A7_9GAMM|nr:iron-containing alcohol dehydrogenase [Fluviicoccus keumensis]RZU45078.1 NADP-dependent alcohol dehydrogenase [Fluviicoccus keumensis]